MSTLTLPPLSANPARLRRSGLHWLHADGSRVPARASIASCYVRVLAAGGTPVPLAEEQNDLQVVLAPREACQINYREGMSKGGYRDSVEIGEWRTGEPVATADSSLESDTLLALVLAGRRGFESGEGRGSLLAGWHERVRGFWEGPGQGPFGTVLALGTCEQTAIFRGDDMAFLSWFARAPGPAQIIAVGDERCVHSSAVALQHVRRTPAEAVAITEAVYGWIGEHLGHPTPDSFPAFLPAAARGSVRGRWPQAQELSFALHLLIEAVGAAPILERSEVLTGAGMVELNPPDVIAMTLASELSSHYRHKRTGWIVAMHGYRFGAYIGPAISDWLRRDFEPLKRTVEDVRGDLACLADEIKARTGARLLIQNLIASSDSDRISNYAWLGEAFDECLPVFANEANLMLGDLTCDHTISVVDSDALAVELGVQHCPDRFHASRELIDEQRAEVHRVLQQLAVPGF